MDWFKKQKLSSWIIALLVALNVLTLATLWSVRFDRPRKGFQPPGAGAGPEGPDNRVMGLLQEELNLSEGQIAQIRAMRESHFEAFRDFETRAMELRRGIMDALFADPSDTVRIREMAEALGRLYAERELKNAEHFQQLREVYTPAQREQFRSLMHEILPNPPGENWRGMPDNGGGPPRGPGPKDQGPPGGRRPPPKPGDPKFKPIQR